MNLLADRASEALVRAIGHRQPATHDAADLAGAGRSSRFSIAISRETGTRGPAVARAVGQRLGWSVFDHELLELVAQELHVSADLLKNIDEHHITWLQECVEAFAAVPGVREQKYVCQLIETLLSLAARGNCIVVGRGSPFVMPPASTLRVRLSAPLADRIAVVSRDMHLSRSDAARFVEKTDSDRSQFIKLHFLRDPSEARHYDLFLNTSQFSIENCAALIADAWRQKSRAAGAPIFA